jgi:2-polyprenyl-3-methyl-5-hydroxy-6-metoxy-1,4-benzoquinol methylase
MARQFPHVRVKGVDVIPTPLNAEQLPPNIDFEIDDINVGLSHFANRFDIVHMRAVGAGLTDYEQAVTYAVQCVKPGGMMLLVEYNMQLNAEDMVTTQKMATPNQEDGSWVQRFFYGTHRFNSIFSTGLQRNHHRGALWRRHERCRPVQGSRVL